MRSMTLSTVVTLIKATRPEAEQAADSARKLGFSVELDRDPVRGAWICTCTKPAPALPPAPLPDAAA